MDLGRPKGVPHTSHGTVSHVAPKTDVNIKTNEADAMPYDVAAPVLPAAVAFWPPLDMPPAKNMAMPIPTLPQYMVHRRPMRSNVKTQTSVENI